MTDCSCATTYNQNITDISGTSGSYTNTPIYVPLDCNNLEVTQLLGSYRGIKDESEKTSFRNCVFGLIEKNDLVDLLDTYNDKLNNYETVNELNNNSMYIYINDYWYVIVKSIVYSLVLLIFIYFYGISNIIENVKSSANTIKEQTIKVKDKIVKEQIVDMPK
uniref:Uncharacterized protein n=1 Tax=viral metagenome TaxID=1070528 RepID=A0A6C0ET65_9ZZZZ